MELAAAADEMEKIIPADSPHQGNTHQQVLQHIWGHEMFTPSPGATGRTITVTHLFKYPEKLML